MTERSEYNKETQEVFAQISKDLSPIEILLLAIDLSLNDKKNRTIIESAKKQVIQHDDSLS